MVNNQYSNSSLCESDEPLAELLTLTREVDEYGSVFYRNSDGLLHRIHGPAIIHTDGTKHWFRNGVLHKLKNGEFLPFSWD